MYVHNIMLVFDMLTIFAQVNTLPDLMSCFIRGSWMEDGEEKDYMDFACHEETTTYAYTNLNVTEIAVSTII